MSATIGDALATRLVGKRSESIASSVTPMVAAAEGESNEADADEGSATVATTPRNGVEDETKCLMPDGQLLTSLGRAYSVEIKYVGRGGAPMAATSLKPKELEAQVICFRLQCSTNFFLLFSLQKNF